MSLEERLNAAKARQEAANEATNLEKEARMKVEKRGVLSDELETVIAELAITESAAAEAAKALESVNSFIADQGENMDPVVATEISEIRQEALAIQARFVELQAKVSGLTQELAAFDEGAQVEENTPDKTPGIPETPSTAEMPIVEAADQAGDLAVDKPTDPTADLGLEESIDPEPTTDKQLESEGGSPEEETGEKKFLADIKELVDKITHTDSANQINLHLADYTKTGNRRNLTQISRVMKHLDNPFFRLSAETKSRRAELNSTERKNPLSSEMLAAKRKQSQEAITKEIDAIHNSKEFQADVAAAEEFLKKYANEIADLENAWGKKTE